MKATRSSRVLIGVTFGLAAMLGGLGAVAPVCSQQAAGAPAPGPQAVLSVHTGAGVLYGTATELVFAYSGGSRFIVSELDWALQPVFLAQSALRLKAFGSLSASLVLTSAFPAQSGFITDSDWLNYPADTTTKTNFSRHECFTERALIIDARLGWDFPLGKLFRLTPFGELGGMLFEWTARNGYLQYPDGWFSATPPDPPYPSYTEDPIIEVYGTGIVYQQNYLIPALGLEMGLRLGRRLDVALSFAFSPFVTCKDLDNHEFAGADYTESMASGMSIQPSLALELRLSDRAALALDASYRRIWGLVGDVRQTITGADYPGAPGPPGTTYVDPRGGGASYEAIGAAVSFSLSL
jgi:outer membrane protease